MAFQLETPRLLLRLMTEIDAPFIFELNNDPEVIQYTGDNSFNNLEEALAFIRNYKAFENFGRARLSTFVRETGEYIGWCGLKFLPEQNETDIGYRLLKKHWGNGYATEAAAACLTDGFDRLQLKRIIGTAMKANTASINVFKKLGLTYSYDENCGCQPGVVYTITKAEWQNRQKN
jgi:RimJ/RimL family protein N-acetyltransferase